MKTCPVGRDYNPNHATCRSCDVSCKESMNAKAQERKSKYGASKTVVDGMPFDSKKEAGRYQELKMMERAGEISDLQLQVPFELVPKNKKFRAVKYLADFVYKTKAGEQVVEDVKSVATKTTTYIIKKKLMFHAHGIQIVEVL